MTAVIAAWEGLIIESNDFSLVKLTAANAEAEVITPAVEGVQMAVTRVHGLTQL